MANQWFRMYSEFSTDQKVQMLSEADQRRLLMLFCLRCNGNETLHDEEVTFMLRISNDSWLITKNIFIEKGFINEHNEIINWDKRQYISDSSTLRVAKHRANKKTDVTLCNVTVTPPEQNRTEQNIIIVPIIKSRFDEFWNAYPKSSRKVGKTPCLRKWKAKKLDSIADKIIDHVTKMKSTKQWIDGFEPAPLTYINQERWNDDFNSENKITESNTPDWKKKML